MKIIYEIYVYLYKKLKTKDKSKGQGFRPDNGIKLV